MPPFHDSDICRGIIDSLPIGLCVVDMQKRIVFWSDGAECITGHLRHEVIGHSCIAETLLHCDQPGCEFCHEDCPAPTPSRHRTLPNRWAFCITKPEMLSPSTVYISYTRRTTLPRTPSCGSREYSLCF